MSRLIFSAHKHGRTPARMLADALAPVMVFSLGTGAATFGAAMLVSAPVAAQDYSKSFRQAYAPVQEQLKEDAPDWTVVRGFLPALQTAVANDDDRNAVGSLFLQAGSNLNDPQLQRQGLQMMVDSGKTAPEEIGKFNYYLGSLAFQDKDYAAARTALETAQQAGYSAPDVDIPGLIAESYFAEGNGQAGIDYIKTASQERIAAGGQVPETWLLKALQSSYDQGLTTEAVEVSDLLLSTYPTAQNWMKSLQVINAMNEFPPQQQLDLLRLMRTTDAISDRTEYVRYIEAADPRIMSNEVNAVLAEAVAAGKLDTADTYYVEVKSIADQRAAQDRSDAPNLVTEANSASDPMRAAEAGDVSYSLGEYAQAASMYQLALDKGIADRETLLTRLGMAQTMGGMYAEAQATLDQVTGARAPIAHMWSVYAETQAGSA